MKFTTTKDELLKAAGIAGHLATTRATLPILQNLYLEANDKGLLVRATDLEQTLEIEIKGETDEKGKVTVPSRLLTEYIQNNTDKEITIKSDDTNLTVSSLNHSANIKGLPAEEYPTIPKPKTEASVLLAGGQIARAVGATVFASANDDSRPILNSLLWRFQGKSLTIVGTDGYRLALYKINLNNSFEGDYVIPKKAMSELIRVIDDGEVEMVTSGSQVSFISNGIRLTSRVLEGAFPAYEAIIPKSTTQQVQLNGALLLQDLRLASLFSRDSAYSTKLGIGENKLKVTAVSAQVGESSSEITLDVAVKSALTVSVNAQYLIEVLGVLSGEIELGFIDEKSPIVVKSTNKDFTDYIYLVMPLRSS